MKQFDIWLANLNPQVGTEVGKIRPVVVIQGDRLNKHLRSTIVCPITTQILRPSSILRVHLEKDKFGLLLPSDIIIDQLRALDNSRFQKKLGALDQITSEEVLRNIAYILEMAQF